MNAAETRQAQHAALCNFAKQRAVAAVPSMPTVQADTPTDGTPFDRNGWTCRIYISQTRQDRYTFLASHGEGRNRKAINVTITPEQIDRYEPRWS